MSGCRLQQCCCTCTSYYDAAVLTTSNLCEDYPSPVLEPPVEEPVAATPRIVELPVVSPRDETTRVAELPAVRPSAVTEPAPVVQAPVVVPPSEAPPAPPKRRATRQRLFPVQFPRVFYTIKG